MRTPILVAATLVSILAPRIAGADEALATTATADAEPARSPGFSLLDRFDEDSRAGIDVTYEAVVGNRYFVRGDVHAHYIDPRYHIGGYVQVQR